MSVNLAAPSGFNASDLVFNDSFLGSSLNTNSWNTFFTDNITGGAPWSGNGSGGSAVGGGNDADYAMPSQISVNNGLTITAVRQSITADGTTYPVTSGALSTYGKMEFTGGYIQISMKQPSGDGAWPALWLVPGKGAGLSGVDNFELDIQEGGVIDGSANPNNVFSYNLHAYSGSYSNDTMHGGEVDTGVNLSAGFNTYGMNWIPGKSITFYFNGKQIGQITSAQAQIPDEPMELIMNLGVADTAASAWHTILDSSTPYSMAMQVADVQIYQTPGSGETIMGSNVTSVAPPTVTISSVGGTVTSRAQTVAGTVDLADAGSKVSIYDGTTQIGTATAASNGGWSANVTLTNRGINVVTAADANAAGSGTSNSVTYTVAGRRTSKASAASTVAGTSPVNGAYSATSLTNTIVGTDPSFPVSNPANTLAGIISGATTSGVGSSPKSWRTDIGLLPSVAAAPGVGGGHFAFHS